MARSVKWTSTAWNDLKQVSEYIARDSQYYAAAFVGEVRDAARSLAYMARRGRVVPELADPSVRELVVGRYRLLYRITEQGVYIIAFIHGARDLTALWRREKQPS
jgi:plasmid stabilization system protein ParE